MATATIRFIVRTPHEVVFDANVRSVRVVRWMVSVRRKIEPGCVAV